jgi:hypothetical protein
MYSFFACCKKHEVNPLEWLTDVLKWLSDYKANRIVELLPHKWKLKTITKLPLNDHKFNIDGMIF